MRWPEAGQPVRMQRVALVAPTAALRDVLVRVADEGIVEVDVPPAGAGESTGAAAGRLARAGAAAPDHAALTPYPPDLDALEEHGRDDLLAGEAQVEAAAQAAVVRGDVTGLAGWTAAADVPRLADRVAEAGGGVVPIAPPRGLDPPTLLRPGGTVRRSFSPLVETYGTVPYADVDPTLLAGAAYAVMFGMMFGDVGHGALVVLAALLLRTGRPRALARFRRVWPTVAACGVAAMGFGLLYGEFFGPTGVVPVLWLAPLEEPVTLLGAALGVGGVLLGGAYVVGSVNRWREGGWAVALSAPTGLAGASLFVGLGVAVLGAVVGPSWLLGLGVVVALCGLLLTFLGLLAAAAGGPGARTAQALVELFDAVMRLGTNLASFARLAAFGLTHAALGLVVWNATTALWAGGGLLVLAAVVVFLVGNALAFALEALVAAVQALRLEYYELFSRVFTLEGRPFRPWHVPLDTTYQPEPVATPAADVPDRGRNR